MISFEWVHLANFGPFEEARLELTKRGLVLIRAENRDTTAADSNGAGKSHLFKALTWALFGESLEGKRDKALIKRGAKAAGAVVRWHDDSGKVYTVTRTTRPSLALEADGKDVSAPVMKDTQAEVHKLLGMDFDTWRSTVLYGQGDLARFADPDTPDAERKAILKRVLRLEVLDGAHTLAKRETAGMEAELSRLRGRGPVLEANLAQAERNLVGWKESLTGKMEALEETSGAAKGLPKLRKLEEQLKQKLEDARQAEKQAVELRAQATTLQADVRSAEAESRALASERATVERQLGNFKDGKCPTCGTPATAKPIAALLGDLGKRQRELTGAARDCEAKLAKLKGLATAKLNEAKLIVLPKDAAEVDQRLAETAAAILKAETAKARSKDIADDIGKLEGQIAEAEKARERSAQELEQTQVDITKVEADSAHHQFWLRGLSNSGLPSWMMDAIIPELTERANHYLGVLSDGDLRIAFDTQTVLKTGEARDRFAIMLDVEGAGDVNPSGGQRKKITIAADLALMDLVAVRERAAIDLLLIDEIFDGLDATGRARAMDLLTELRRTRSTILVISHDPAFSEMFERELIVVKEGGTARLGR